MGHQVVIYGIIECPAAGDHARSLKMHNETVINGLPDDDHWPWFIRSMLALPGDWPKGTYREQIIHFGLSMKDNPPLNSIAAFDPEISMPEDNGTCVEEWIGEFENLLRNLYWFGASVHISTEFEPNRVFSYIPTKAASENMLSFNPQPISEWCLRVARIPDQET